MRKLLLMRKPEPVAVIYLESAFNGYSFKQMVHFTQTVKHKPPSSLDKGLFKTMAAFAHHPILAYYQIPTVHAYGIRIKTRYQS